MAGAPRPSAESTAAELAAIGDNVAQYLARVADLPAVLAEQVARGARPQRVLWASTSTKDPSYPDTKYVEPLIGEHTVNTMPESTIDAFRDHGAVVPGSVEQGVEEARAVPAQLAALGIDLHAATEELVEEGIAKFEQPFDALLENLEGKRAALGA